MTTIAENLATVQRNVAAAAKVSDRNSTAVELIAVSKTHNADLVRQALDAGQCIFGENRVQEAKGKWPELLSDYPDAILHLIGPLQSNKVADAVALFDVIHTIDREKIAIAVSREMKRQNRQLQLFVQVNTGSEPQKAGIEPADTVDFVKRCRDTHGLPVKGLMCIPPFGENPGPHFALLRKQAAETGLENLSMGMSSDYETAVEMGATHIRVGSAIFGERDLA